MLGSPYREGLLPGSPFLFDPSLQSHRVVAHEFQDSAIRRGLAESPPLGSLPSLSLSATNGLAKQQRKQMLSTRRQQLAEQVAQVDELLTTSKGMVSLPPIEPRRGRKFGGGIVQPPSDAVLICGGY